MNETQAGDANRLPLWQYGERLGERLQACAAIAALCAPPDRPNPSARLLPPAAGYNTSSELYVFIRTLAWYRRQMGLPSLPLQREWCTWCRELEQRCLHSEDRPRPPACPRQVCPPSSPSFLHASCLSAEAYVDSNIYAFARGPDMLVLLSSGAVNPLPAAYSLANLTEAAGKELCDALSGVRASWLLAVAG